MSTFDCSQMSTFDFYGTRNKKFLISAIKYSIRYFLNLILVPDKVQGLPNPFILFYTDGWESIRRHKR